MLLCLLYAGLVIFGSCGYVSKMYSVHIEMEDLPIEVWMVRSLLPLGYLLLTFRFVQVLWSLITGKSDSLHLGDEVADAMKLKSEESL